ncbi:MAG: glycosyltransferase family 9 protein [Oligoflexia bacterium]|nr:glycosyltransferase family 9 protein [Oligoflexia bacterium]
MKKVLFCRIDRIGDLVLTLPSELAWLKHQPNDQTAWIVPEELKFVMEARSQKSEFHLISLNTNVWKRFLQAYRLMKLVNPDIVIFFHAPWWMTLASFVSRVPARWGPRSQWHSFSFLNGGPRQKRSLAEKNEAEYNLDLIQKALGIQTKLGLPTEPYLTADQSLSANWLKEFGELGGKVPYVVVHPGMAGSAENWPLTKYANLVRGIINRGYTVVITGSSADKILVERSGVLLIPGVIDQTEKTSPKKLLAVLEKAKLVVAPSTGVLHLASALGSSVVGIYSPVRVQSPKRWGPIGPKKSVIVPEVHCPGIYGCLGPRCSAYNCMDQISVESVLSCVIEKL